MPRCQAHNSAIAESGEPKAESLVILGKQPHERLSRWRILLTTKTDAVGEGNDNAVNTMLRFFFDNWLWLTAIVDVSLA